MSGRDETPDGDARGADDVPVASFSEQLRQAAQRAGIASVAPGEVPTGGALLTAVGGVRGLVEALLPGILFLVIYTVTHTVNVSVLVPLVLGVAFVVVRAAQRGPLPQAIFGLIFIVISAVLALKSGNAANNFVPGIIINIVSLLVLLVSLAVRWPLIGVVVGLLTQEATEWRHDRAKRRVLAIATWLWVLLFAIRLCFEIPLYLADDVTFLAASKLVLGVPLYAAMLWVTWLLVRTVYRGGVAETVAETPAESPDEA